MVQYMCTHACMYVHVSKVGMEIVLVAYVQCTFLCCHPQRQQVVMVRRWAQEYPNIFFSSMHPGWADTPGEYLLLLVDIVYMS